MKKKWCRAYGLTCKKGEKCPHEHLDKAPEMCDAILEFEGTHYFGFCELDKGHKGNHRCLMFEWVNTGEKATKAHNSYRLRGLNVMMAKLRSSHKK